MSDKTNNKKDPEISENVVVETPVVEEAPVATEEPAVVEEPKVEEVQEVITGAQEVISAPKPAEKQGIGSVGNGAMGVTTFKEEPKKQPVVKNAVVKEETVAIYSSRNVSWQGVGKVTTGYNIVTPAQAEQWLTRDHIRSATPQEVAGEFKN